MDRGPPREALPLPTKPPFTAHLGNLPFDASNVDIEEFFSQCEVTNVRIVEDKMDRRPKGFGYVEFGSLDGLKRALDLNGTQFQGRNVKISVADPRKFLLVHDLSPLAHMVQPRIVQTPEK
jgi:translation initiation factor 4B